MNKTILLKFAACVPFTVGLVGIICAFLNIIFRTEGDILWFGGKLSYSMKELWDRPVLHIASDLLTLHLPFFALGPHFCGVGGILFVADSIERKRIWALFILFCTIVIAGINDTTGAYIYYLNSGDKGFIVPFVATTLGTLGLLLFRDCFSVSQSQFTQTSQRNMAGMFYDMGRRIAITMTLTITALWLLGYCTYFLPAYLFSPEDSSSLYGIFEVPSLKLQVMKGITAHHVDEFFMNNSNSLYGFSVMTAQMAWAAGCVGFGISPTIASIYGLTDSDSYIRDRCWWFLLYVTLVIFVNSWMLHFGSPSYVVSDVGSSIHAHVYGLQIGYGLGMCVALGLMYYSHRIGKPFKEIVKSN